MRTTGKRSRPRKTRVATWPPPKPKKTRHKKHHPLVLPKFEVLPDGAHAVTIPVHTRCLANIQTGNSKAFGIMRSREKKTQRDAVQPCLFGIGISFRGVRMVRLAPSEGLDTGNLWNALKAVQDEIAAHLGVDDGPDSPVTWEVDQERSAAYGVRIEFRKERAKSRDEYAAMERRLAAVLAHIRDSSESAAANGNFVTSQILSNIAAEIGEVLDGAA